MPHLGVRTRSMAATRSSCSTASNPKSRKLSSSADSVPQVVTPRPRSRRRLVTTPAVSLAGEDRCSGADTSSDHSASSASCCSNNVGSVEKNITREFPDLEDEESVEFKTWASYRKSTSSVDYLPSMTSKKEQTTARSPSSEIQDVELFDDLDSTVKSEANFAVVKKKAPFQAEIDDFFDAAEKSVQKHFTNKYNFDFEKEEPLEEGRYEWIRMKP